MEKFVYEKLLKSELVGIDWIAMLAYWDRMKERATAGREAWLPRSSDPESASVECSPKSRPECSPSLPPFLYAIFLLPFILHHLLNLSKGKISTPHLIFLYLCHNNEYIFQLYWKDE